MGLYDRLQKTGQLGGSKVSSQTGFSSSKYYSQNAVSATKFMPSSSGTGEPAPLDTRRPYSNVGKFNVNILGNAMSKPSPQLQEKPGAFEGVPVLGGLADIAENVMKGPVGWIPFVGQAFQFQQYSQNVMGPDYVKQNQAAFDQYLREQTNLGATPTDMSRFQWEFMRQDLVKKKNLSPLIADLFFGAAPTNIGEAVGQTVKEVFSPGVLTQRALSGTGSRIKDLMEADDRELEYDPTLIDIRNRRKQGVIDDNAALDELAIAGQSITNPLGQSDWAEGIRSLGKGNVFQLPTEVVANLTAGAASLGLEIITDPTTILSLGVGTGIRVTAKGAAKAILKFSDERVTKVLAEEARILGRELTKNEIDTIGQRARNEAMRELNDALPPGAAPTNANWVRYGLNKGVTGMREATSAGGYSTPLLRNQNALRWVQNVEKVLDPLTLFGKGMLGRATNKLVALQVVDGTMDVLDRRKVAHIFDVLENAGVENDRMSADLGTAMANVSSQVGGELYARMAARMGIGVEDATDPVMLSNLAEDMLSRQGTGVQSLVKHKFEKILHLVVPAAGEDLPAAIARERKYASRLLQQMYDISSDKADDVVSVLDEKQLSIIRVLGYGNRADTLLNTRTIARSEAIAAGLDPSFADRFIFFGENQLSRGGAKRLQKIANLKNMVEVRRQVSQYDVLEYNLSQSLSDEDLLVALKQLLNDMMSSLPQEVPDSNLSPAMKAFRDKYGPDVEVGLRPDEVFGTGKNKDGRITSVNPFMDYVRGGAIEVGDVPPPNIMQQWQQRLLGSISGSQVLVEQQRRFAQRMALDTGATRAQSDSMLRLIRAKASDVGASGGRGLYRTEAYAAAREVKLPKTVRDKMTERQLQLAIFWAYEGSVSKVGLSQKGTGWLKTKSLKLPGLSQGALGIMAERIYPLVRFKWNPMFQLQEVFESPILLTARGMLSPGQFVDTASLGRKRINAAVRRTPEARQAYRTAQEGYDDLSYQTALMMDTFATDSRFAADMIEQTDTVRWGSAAASRMASGTDGQMLTKLKVDGGVTYIKARAQTVAFRRTIGDHMARTVGVESPVQWAAIKQHYGTLDDGEAGVRLFNDYLARSDPDSAFSAIASHSNPGEFMRPAFLGARSRMSERVVSEALGRNMPGSTATTPVPFATIRRRFKDPKDTEINDQWVEQTLREAGADEWYIEKTKWHLGAYEDEADFEKAIVKLTGDPAEAAAVMEYHRRFAKEEGVPLLESLADKYMGSPKALDQNGAFKGNALFQLIADAAEARGLRVPARDAPELAAYWNIGPELMPDLSLPPGLKTLAWEESPRAKHTELVPLSRLIDIMPGNPAVRLTAKERAALARSIKTNGMQEPIQLTYYHADGTVDVGEGNHRISVLAEKLDKGQREREMVPVTVFTHQRNPGPPGSTKVRGAVADDNGYVSSELRPSDIGITTREEAEFARSKASMGQTLSKLTDAQQKGYKAQRIRAARAANPKLGLPKPVAGQENGMLIARTKSGEVKHRIGPGKTHQEWTEELQAVLTPDELKEHADWYLDMRRGFMALADGEQETAVRLLMAFGVTQLNTSPVDGMRYLTKVMERIKRGQTFEQLSTLEMQKVAGLNGELLTQFLETGYLDTKGLGFKLIDFIDSLIGNPTRTIPVAGPNGRWGPVAGDIWAKRDVGYVDAKMLRHLEEAYGDTYTITGVKGTFYNEAGELEEGAMKSFTLTNKETGEVIELPSDMVGGNPNDHEYDAIVEFYNDASDYMNESRFMGRTDWTPPMAQALGWFKAKRVFGDETGDPRAAFFDNAWHVSVEVSPTRNSVASEVYPALTEETERQIAGRIAPKIGDEAAHMAGVNVLGMRGSTRGIWDEGADKARLGTVVNYEVFGSPEGAETFSAIAGHMGQQGRMRAVRITSTKPTKKNSSRHSVQLRFPANIDKEEMYAVVKDLTERERFFADADLITAADGTHVLHIVSEPGESLPAFSARGDDVMLRQFYDEVVDSQGYARGRYIDPDQPMLPGKRRQDILDRGNSLRSDAIRENEPLAHWTESSAKVTKRLYKETREVWGGFTIDLKTGKLPRARGAKKGGGPYASAVADTRSISPSATEEEFTTALDEFIEENRVLLEQDHSLGVFYNEDTGNIEFDVNQIVDGFDDAEALQLALDRPGGAYDFTTGKGVYSPIFDKTRAHGVERGFADVIEMNNNWKTQKNGKGYLDVLRKPAKEDKTTRGGVAEQLEREAGDWGRVVYEDAYQSVAAREVAAHRAARSAGATPGFDLDDPAGYLQRSPRGTRGTILGRADARSDAALWQRTTPTGKPRGALTEPGATLSGTGKRSQVYVSPTRKLSDTLPHEMAHDYLNRVVHPSAIRRAKAVYAGRSGTPPTPGAKSRASKFTVDEQEWLADQLVEYLRTGDASKMPSVLQPLAAHYSTTLNKSRRRAKLSPEAEALFRDLDKVPAPPKGYNYDVDEEAIIKWMYSAHRRADRMAADLVHFKTERSWLERSLNHPYFGLYPASYMWGKILPEMLEFLLFRPFGLKAPLVGLDMVNTMYQHVMLQMESDPELREWMAENEDAWRALSMLVPGLPWDLPVNVPLPLRRYIEAAATNVAADQRGDQPEDYGAWEAFVTDIDYPRIAKDVLGYTFGPAAGAGSLMEYPGLAADIVGGTMTPGTEEELAGNEQFIPPTVSQPGSVPPAAVPTAPAPAGAAAPPTYAPAPPAAQPEGNSDIEELELELAEQYNQVAEDISE